MACAQFAGVDLVIGEVFVAEFAVFIADQTIRLHLRRIEFDLDFDILGDRVEGAAKFADENFVGLAVTVDVVVIAIALVGKEFHFAVLEIAFTKAQHG